MTSEERTKRAEIVAEARSWIATPYCIMGRVKGAGCDCASFLMSVAVNCGLVKESDFEVYSPDCWAHWSDEKYLKKVLQSTVKVLESVAYRSGPGFPVLPGALVLTCTSAGRYLNHGAIVTEWPMIVHAVTPRVQEIDATGHHLWAYRKIEAFDFKGIVAP